MTQIIIQIIVGKVINLSELIKFNLLSNILINRYNTLANCISSFNLMSISKEF